MEKKGQVTIFVVVGILLILVFVIGFYFLNNNSEEEQIIDDVNLDEKVKPIEDYVKNCIYKIGIDAVKELGAHGGYIDPLNPKLKTRNFRYNPTEPTKSDLISLTGDKDALIPYYLHVPGRASYFNYGLETSAPEVDEMEEQIAKYVVLKMPECLDDFYAFTLEGIEINSSTNASAQVYIKEEIIDIFYNHELAISYAGKTAKIKKFNSIIKFPLLKYYAIALSIYSSAYNTQFPESVGKSLIVYHSGVDFNMLPPLVAHSRLPYAVTWNQNKVKQDLNGLLTSYVPALQVVGSKDYSVINTTGDFVEDTFLSSLSMPIYNDSIDVENSTWFKQGWLSNVSISFIYPQNSLSLKVSPSQGAMLRPSYSFREGSTFIPEDKSYNYKFFYDLSYPLVVEIRETNKEYAIEEFSWVFALESNIIENKAALAWELGYGTANWDTSYLQVNISLPGDEVLNDPRIDPQYRDQISNDFASRSFSKSIFCEESTWISGNITVSVEDEYGSPLSGVNVAYSCGDYDACYVGETTLSNGKAQWSGKLPSCEGGYFSVTKNGYSSRRIPLSIEEDSREWIATQMLYKVREVKISAVKKQIEKEINRTEDWEWIESTATISSEMPIDSENEQVVFIINQIDEDVSEPISSTFIFGKDSTGTYQQLKLVPGEYEINAVLIDYTGHTIPAECSRFCTIGLLGVCFDTKYIPDTSIDLPTLLWGGLEFSKQNATSIRFTSQDLDRASEIEFTVIKLPDLQKSAPPGGCIDHLNEMNKLSDYSMAFFNELSPKII